MVSLNPLAGPALAPLFDSILPDFVLAFTFFTALCYAVVDRHSGRQRPAAAVSVVPCRRRDISCNPPTSGIGSMARCALTGFE